jgi:hypothetical protein
MRLCWLTLVPLCLVALFGLAVTMVLPRLIMPPDVMAVVTGPAYGRLPGMPHLVLGVLGHVLAWLVPLAIAAVLVVLARRKYGQQHPALKQLTGAAS